jgi:hypothetical protein
VNLAERLRTVRLVYFDEAGSSQDEVQEPIIAVAAIILHGDLQTGPIERDAGDIIATLVPAELRRDFEFHAKELFSGSTKLRGWRKEDRYAALSAFLQLVPKHNLPVICIGIVKEGYWRAVAHLKERMSREDLTYIIHESAFMNCADAVEIWFRSNANFERGFCIADNTKARDKLKRNFRDFRGAALVEEQRRLDHLVDTIYFGDSRESIFLQLADCCAFFIKRTMMDRADVEPFYRIIENQVAPKPLRLLFR